MRVSFSLLLIILLVVSCNTPKVFTDYAAETNFGDYKSFNFYAIENPGLSPLDQDRVYVTLVDTLVAKGFEEKLIPDFKINFFAEVFNQTSNSNFGIGIGGYAGGIGTTVSPQSSRRTIALTVEFADGLTNSLFWQGIVEARFKENLKGKARKEFIQSLVSKILKKYPPEPKNNG
jgi:hypothetical protein